MLWVFSLAITPWGALHHHEEAAPSFVEKNCTHKLHLKTEKDTCLICKAHFEKDYYITHHSFVTYLAGKILANEALVISSSYTDLISTSLRGPPVFS